ncbi:unnamed protein product [Rotaria sp. Silwood1]|nr:unnamed protein product [Rotaria sp. Silwood1]
MSPDLFKRILCKTILSYCHQIRQWLTNAEILQFIQHHAQLMCTIFQLQMDNDYWKHAINVALPVINWLSRMSKDITKRNFINWNYPRTEKNIKHRQKKQCRLNQ